ncbi:hypothetical protein CXB51_007871 [Gossypium anomalum]|uniref:Aminotransferase-like plant mobile domain-containing protein n=1 Tax=Gossypium anomalum TaxID=47600 RepID=A0A8J5ZCH9_9ROSI|nr:hypothetical protein CXB51_007871 [Gossypium anomalum]
MAKAFPQKRVSTRVFYPQRSFKILTVRGPTRVHREVETRDTFHLPYGEYTITLEDVQLQLRLPVDGLVLIVSTPSIDWGAICYDILGVILDHIYGDLIKMGWLRDTFLKSEDDSTEVERIQYARAYIIEIIGGYPMLDLSRNLIHLRWLLKLVDFRVVGELSWGFAMLATLYREMCKAMKPNKTKIGGCLSLLQSWARFHFLFLRPRVNHPYTFPLITRWNHSTSYVGIPTALEDIRLVLNQRSEAHGGSINSTYTITGPNASSNDAHITTPLNYARCVS